MTAMLGLSDPDGKALISDTLRMYVGQGKRTSWADLADATEDDERKLRSYVERDPPTMPATVFLRVFAALPPEAFGRICRRMGFTMPAQLDVDEVATVRRAMTEAAQFVAEGTEAFEDGIIDSRERRTLGRRAQSLIPKLQLLAGGADA